MSSITHFDARTPRNREKTMIYKHTYPIQCNGQQNSVLVWLLHKIQEYDSFPSTGMALLPKRGSCFLVSHPSFLHGTTTHTFPSTTYGSPSSS